MKTIRILLKNGCIIDAKGDEGVDLVGYDLDSPNANQVQDNWDADTKDLAETEIF